MEELKSCPICGGGATYHATYDLEWVECDDCYLQTDSCAIMADENVFEKWNNRKPQSDLISVDDIPVNGNYDWKIGDKAIAYGGYFFEIEWDGDSWTSIGGDDFTHWMPLPNHPEVNK